MSDAGFRRHLLERDLVTRRRNQCLEIASILLKRATERRVHFQKSRTGLGKMWKTVVLITSARG